VQRHLLAGERSSRVWGGGGMKVRDLYSLRQVSAMKTYPIPAKYREKILVIVWFENVFKITILEL
jgi:hypothetical protein